MWRQATSTPQKLAVINGLLPLTASEFLKALIFFCGDEDEAVQKAAIEKLRFTQSNEIKKIISPEIPENSVRTLTKLAGERRDSSIIISLLMTGKLQRNWVLEFLATNDRTFWTISICHICHTQQRFRRIHSSAERGFQITSLSNQRRSDLSLRRTALLFRRKNRRNGSCGTRV